VHEIKLRVWFVEAKKMYSWEELINNIGLSESVFIETDLWKPMQFTGLKDKNGVGQEIYDGDLIGTPSGIVCQVVYRELYGQWWTKFNNTSHKSQWDKPLFEVAGNSYLKVLGNIHETPADGRTN